MRYLVTGGCGFIGKRLIAKLIGPANLIRVVDNLEAGTLADLGAVAPIVSTNAPAALESDRIQIIVGDVTDPQLALEATRDVDAIVHLAANTGVGPSIEDPRLDCMRNVIGTFNYLDACRINGVKRFVLASSSAAVGEQEPPISEMVVPRPVSPYAASKLAGEAYCSAYAKSYGISAIALRFGNVYGPGSAHKESVVAKFIRRALNSEVLEIYGDGNQTRDFIYIDDLVGAIICALRTEDIDGEVLQIATAEETTIGQIAAKLIAVLEAEGIPPVEVCKVNPRVGDVRRSYADTTKALRLLNWRATTALDDGLRNTLRWFMHDGKSFQSTRLGGKEL